MTSISDSDNRTYNSSSSTKVSTLLQNVTNYSLSYLLYSHKWSQFQSLLSQNPNLAKLYITEDTFLPIHFALQSPSVPLSVIKILHNSYPKSLSISDNISQRLPLHYATLCPLKIIDYIIQNYPQGLIHQDNNGDTPLLYYLFIKEPELSIIKLLSNEKVCQLVDSYHMTPLHRAVKCASLEIVKYLVSIFPYSMRIVGDGNMLPKAIAMYHEKKNVYNWLCEEEKRFFGDIMYNATEYNKEDIHNQVEELGKNMTDLELQEKLEKLIQEVKEEYEVKEENSASTIQTILEESEDNDTNNLILV